jgi:hypothetical protein
MWQERAPGLGLTLKPSPKLHDVRRLIPAKCLFSLGVIVKPNSVRAWGQNHQRYAATVADKPCSGTACAINAMRARIASDQAALDAARTAFTSSMRRASMSTSSNV